MASEVPRWQVMQFAEWLSDNGLLKDVREVLPERTTKSRESSAIVQMWLAQCAPPTASDVVWEVDRLLRAVRGRQERDRIRRVLSRFLRHPEIAGHGGTVMSLDNPHPKGNGNCHASRVPKTCIICGHARDTHDIDGQRVDCEGYVEVKYRG